MKSHHALILILITFSVRLKTKITYLPHWVKNTYTAEAHTQRTIPTMATSLGRTVTGGNPLGWKFKANLESRTRKKNADQNLNLKLGIKIKVCTYVNLWNNSALWSRLHFGRCSIVKETKGRSSGQTPFTLKPKQLALKKTNF